MKWCWRNNCRWLHSWIFLLVENYIYPQLGLVPGRDKWTRIMNRLKDNSANFAWRVYCKTLIHVRVVRAKWRGNEMLPRYTFRCKRGSGWRHREKESGRIQTIPVQRTTTATSSPSRFEHGCFETRTLDPRETPSCLGTQTLNPTMLDTNYKQNPKKIHPRHIYPWGHHPSIHPSFHPQQWSIWILFHPGHNTHGAFAIHPSTIVHLDVVPS